MKFISTLFILIVLAGCSGKEKRKAAEAKHAATQDALHKIAESGYTTCAVTDAMLKACGESGLCVVDVMRESKGCVESVSDGVKSTAVAVSQTPEVRSTGVAIADAFGNMGSKAMDILPLVGGTYGIMKVAEEGLKVAGDIDIEILLHSFFQYHRSKGAKRFAIFNFQIDSRLGFRIAWIA